MTQEDKELLFKDLSARLPYKPKIKFSIIGIEKYEVCDLLPELVTTMFLNEDADIRPYLRPMSSMIEEEVKEFYNVECMDAKVGYIKPTWNWHFTINGIDWLLEHQFDYRGLIEKGLALEAPKDMYKI